jgi:Holliday junction resolvase
MSKSQRNKGQRGERELCSLLSDELGVVVKRNLSQTRAGGADCIEIPGWSIEIKFQETLKLNEWWQQTLDQADSEEPILFYRKSRQPWKAMVNLSSINRDYEGMDYNCIVDFNTACMLIRESL